MQTAISHLNCFVMQFPDHRLLQSGAELRYLFGSKCIAQVYEGMASRMIKKSGLALVVELEEWKSRSLSRWEMIVKPVPEPEEFRHDYADEVQDDEGLGLGWWNQTSEQ